MENQKEYIGIYPKNPTDIIPILIFKTNKIEERETFLLLYQQILVDIIKHKDDHFVVIATKRLGQNTREDTKFIGLIIEDKFYYDKNIYEFNIEDLKIEENAINLNERDKKWINIWKMYLKEKGKESQIKMLDKEEYDNEKTIELFIKLEKNINNYYQFLPEVENIFE